MAVATDIVGTVGVDVIPIAPLFDTKLRAMVLPGADKLGEDLGAAIARTMSVKIAEAIPKAISEGAKAAKAGAVRQGESTGGAFADSLRAKLTAAFKAMPKLDIGLSDTGVDAQLARLRAKLEDLRNKRIGIDISVSDAEAKLQEIDDRLARLGASSPNVAVRVDVATARAAIADIRAEIDEASRNPLDIRVRVGQFRTNLLAQVEAAQASLPAIEIDADTDPARRELDRYRAELAAIPVRVRTDAAFDDAAALAEIDRLRLSLDRLSARRVDIDVRADAARASAELAAVRAEADALDAKRINLKLDAGSARGSVMALGIALASLAAPALPVIAAGAGAVAAALTAAGAAVGAFGLAAAPGIRDVVSAMHAQTAATNDTTKATSAQANAGVTAAQQALTMAGAQQALASAQRSAAQSIHSADEQVAQAERAVATATQTAADQRKQALQGVKDAEDALTHAQRSSKDAEDALVQARATAAQQLRDLNAQLADGALSARAAELQVERTRIALQSARANPNTNPLDLAEAQLAYDQALQAQKEQKQSLADLTKSAAAQQKAGVDGNDAVKSAAERLADAQKDVADKTQAVADAQANVAKVAKTSAQAIADAQRQEADAYSNAANARANAADSISSAERGIASARLAASKVTGSATTKEDAYQKALAKLSPSARDLFDAIAGPHGLKSAFTDWSKTLQPEVLPLFTRGIDGAKASLPGLTPLVLSAADGLGILFDKASAELKTPFWHGFKEDIQSAAEPAVIGLGVAFGNTVKGMAGVVDAFLPHMTGIAANMDRITGRFSNWGSRLKGSPGFESFLDYVKINGPKVAGYIGEILTTVLAVAKDVQPVTEGIMGPLLAGLAWIATNMPDVVKVFWGLYLITKLQAPIIAALAFGMTLYNLAMAPATAETTAFSAALASTGISEIILAIEAAVALLALGLYELWQHAGWFRDGLKAAWKGIGVAFSWLWTSVIKPTSAAIATAFVAIGDAAVWLWKNALQPTFNAIWYAVRFLVTVFLTILITPVYLAIKFVLAPIFVWLWTNAIKPSFDAIGAAAVWLWKSAFKPSFQAIGDFATATYYAVLKPVFDAIKSVFKGTGDTAQAMWKTSIKPAFDFIGGKASWLYNVALKPQFELIKAAVGKVADAFSTAKDGIDLAWSKVADIAKKPVKFVIQHVYNDGIVPVWNAIAKVTGVDDIQKMDLKGWATGGVLPGYTPGSDPHQFYSPTGGRIDLSGGEAVMRPEWTRAVGPAFVNAMNSAARSGGVGGVRRAMGVPGFSGGGILGGLGGLWGDLTAGVTKPTGTSDYLSDPTKLWAGLSKTVKGLVSQFTHTPWEKMIAQLPMAIIKGLKNKALDAATNLVGGQGDGKLLGGGLAYKTNWDDVILQALQMVGQPAGYLGITRRRMMQESGGNPTAVNLWDSNAKAGHPSVGLMQLIAGTFKAHAGPFLHTGPFAYGVSEDPLAQFYASMKYALGRYGSLPAAYNRAGGYDDGGYLPPGDFSVFNHTGKPEPVFTASQWDTLRANVTARNQPSTCSPQILVSVGGERLTEHIDYRIEVYDSNTAAGINSGRRF